MNNTAKLLLTGVFIGFLTGCSNAGSDQVKTASKSPEATKQTVITESFAEITWEDLMPEGEDELLETLYVEFYEEFERNMMQDSSTLAEAAKDSMASESEDMSAFVAEGSAADTMEQIGTFNVVNDLDGKRIRVPGYVVPFDFSADAQHKEFLLVPYFGACLHTPPPPPNQIIFVKADPAAKIADIYEPVWLEGTLATGKYMSDLGNSAYELKLSNLEPYEY